MLSDSEYINRFPIFQQTVCITNSFVTTSSASSNMSVQSKMFNYQPLKYASRRSTLIVCDFEYGESV